jgi:hypothetical protein
MSQRVRANHDGATDASPTQHGLANAREAPVRRLHRQPVRAQHHTSHAHRTCRMRRPTACLHECAAPGYICCANLKTSSATPEVMRRTLLASSPLRSWPSMAALCMWPTIAYNSRMACVSSRRYGRTCGGRGSHGVEHRGGTKGCEQRWVPWGVQRGGCPWGALEKAARSLIAWRTDAPPQDGR